jgi:hypothetical protein
MSKNTGGPAFPRMTLRDYFATHALEEDIQRYLPQTIGTAGELAHVLGCKPIREWARYQHADAMLVARSKE